MARTLWGRFLVLLLAVSAIALSAALALRELMIRDFRDYLEGEHESRVYWITADAERTYEKYGGWNREAVNEDALWALLLGLEVRIVDGDGRLVVDSASALASQSPIVTDRGFPALPGPQPEAAYSPYPLFLRGKQIGTLEVHHLEPPEASTFIARSNRFLVLSVFAMGGVALLLSLFASRQLTRPLKDLAAAAAAVSRGDLSARATVHETGEIGAVSEAFNRMAQGLDRLEQLRKKLLTNLAHELRTPLSAMHGEIEGMVDGLIPTGIDQLVSLLEETNRLRRMLDGVEDLARAQASIATLVKQPVQLKPFLDQLVERTCTAAADKDVSCRVSCPDTLIVNADPDRLTQIIVNVLDNAARAVKDGGRVTIRAMSASREVVVAVEDDGVGIAPSDLPLVFERFFRRSPGGLGIGLAITKELVEAHGGRIEARSELGQGSVFTMHFPA